MSYESRNVKLPDSMWEELKETSEQRGVGTSKLLQLAWDYYRDHLPPIHPKEETHVR